MMEFIAKYTEKNNDRINEAMFRREYDRPLVDYIIDICRNLEVLPAIKLVGYEYITDQTKIRSEIDKKLAKDPKVKNNRTLERLAQQGKTLYDLLVLHFRVSLKGRTEMVTRKVRILKQLKGGYYMKNGKKVMLLNQVVDNSTYVKDMKGKKNATEHVLNFKTTLYPIKLYLEKLKLTTFDGETLIIPHFKLDLFSKVTNPLLYYFAEYGITDTIEMFRLENVVSVVNDIIDDQTYLYFPIRKKLFIEVHEKAFYSHDFIVKFVGTLYDALISDDMQGLDMKAVYDTVYWKGRLAEVYSKKRNPEKGDRVLISFAKMMDPSSKKRLMLRKYHKRNTFTIIRWMMTNYDDLIKKDSNDLKYKRVRANEILAYFFDNYITKNVYSVLNADNPSFDRYIRLLNSINENTLLKAAQAGGKSSPSSMFRYERYNPFDAIDLSRYTLKGPTGLSGGKQKTAGMYRDIYPSQYGRYDLNVCSSSDPGLTGYLTANVQLNKDGYFSNENNEPDNYDGNIEKVLNRFADEDYAKSRAELIERELSRDSDGFIRLKRKLRGKELMLEFHRNPAQYGLYVGGDGFLRLIPKMYTKDQKGFIIIKRKHDESKPSDELKREEDGFIHIRRVYTRLDNKKKKS